MKFKIKQEFDYPITVVEEALFLDENIGSFLVNEMPSLIELEKIEIIRDDDSVKRKVRYLPKPLIKRVGTKKIPPEAMEWVEHSTYDLKTHVLKYSNIPTHPRIGKMFQNDGEILLEESGDKTVRTISGELKIKVPVVGAIAERIIFKTAKTVLEEEAQALKKYLVEKK
ncbi:MAG: DUF2505 family protein [Deltaproteobacteria bacterium]|nr:DUF2505 family protein [Deltaproteobacteria bacterium]